jgi:hypothetical protein
VCPVLPLASCVGALWDAHQTAQEREYGTDDSKVSDEIGALRIRAQETAGSSRARSLAGVLFQVALASDAATRLRDQSEVRALKRRTASSPGCSIRSPAALRDELGEEYAAIEPVIEIYPLKLAEQLRVGRRSRRVRSAAFSIATLLVSINIAVVDRAARVLS